MVDFRALAEKNIFPGESGGDYDALFGYANRPGGKFENVKLTDMTIGEVLAFTDPNGPYGQGVKSQIGRVATPTGAYQVVGTTLRGAVKGLGLDPNQKYDEATQDRIGQWIYETQGPGAWEAWGKGGGGGGGASWTSRSGPGSYSVSTKGAPAMTPFTERQSLIKQLLGGEGLSGKLGPLFNPLEGANPRLEEERFARKAERFGEIGARNAAMMARTNAPVSWLQTLGGIGADLGSTVMGGAADRAGGARQKMMEELLASGQMTPDVLARISALDPEYGAQLSADQRNFEQQQMLAEQERAFTLQRDEANRQFELEMAKLAPEDRTALEQNLIAAGFDPNAPPDGEDGLNGFQREMRKQLAGEGKGGDQLSVTFDQNGNPVITQGPAVVPGVTPPAGVTPAPTPVASQDTSGLSFGELGKVDPGMARGMGPDGQIMEAPIPGSDPDLERKAAEIAATNADKEKIRSGQDVLRAIDQAAEMSGFWSTGTVGKFVRDIGIGGTPATDIEIALRPVLANLGFDALQQMRASSQTGAALGQVTERENTLLQSRITSLDPDGSDELLKENLKYVRDIYDVIINTDPNDPESVTRYEQVMGFPLDQRAANIAAGTPGGTTAPVAGTPSAAPTGGTVSITSDEEYDALPSGTVFIGPDGVERVKP
jgi:hypothetical protein